MTTGRPPHQPDAASRRLVEHHAAIGTPHQSIAKLLKLSLNTLKKHYPEELELGLARANAVVGGTLFAEAKKGNITAAIFWMKTRGGWRETAQGRAQRRHLARGAPARRHPALERRSASSWPPDASSERERERAPAHLRSERQVN